MLTLLMYLAYVLLPYLGVGVATARSIYGKKMEQWRLDPANEQRLLARRDAQLSIKQIESANHNQWCNMKLDYSGLPKYSHLYKNGCDCSYSEKYGKARHTVNTTMERPTPSLAPMFTWPKHAIRGIVTSGDRGRATEIRDAKIAAAEAELNRDWKKELTS